jgi:hypothetical protein
MFGGFGPIIVGIVYYILSLTIDSFSISGGQLLLVISSSYVLAFVQAGVSVFNQIEDWSVAKSLLCHFSFLYITYVTCYLLNTWIPFDINVVLIFTAIFVALYLVIWLTVYFSVKAVAKRLNAKLR